MKRVFIRLIVYFIVFIMMFAIVNPEVFAGVPIPTGVVDGMKSANTGTGMGGTQTAKVLNNVIGLIQIVGSGISLIVITMMGIKYMLAAPSEKADVKKMIMPIIIGCVLLFGAVNLAGVIEDFAVTTLK